MNDSIRSDPSLFWQIKVGSGVFLCVLFVCLTAGIGLELCSFSSLYIYYACLKKRPDVLREIRWFVHDKVAPGAVLFEFCPVLGHRLVPRHVADEKQINAFGFIQNNPIDSFDPMKPQKVFRIFLLGGSSVAGSDIRGYGTISQHLEEVLNQCQGPKGIRYEVINAGVYGYFSGQEVLYFAKDLLRYHPDMVIMFNGHNDIVASFDLQVRGMRMDKNRIVSLEEARTAFLRAQGIWGSLRQVIFCFRRRIAYSYTMMLILKTDYLCERKWGLKPFKADTLLMPLFLPRVRERSTSQSSHVSPEMSETYITNIRSMIGISEAHGVKCLVALQPSGVYQKSFAHQLQTTLGISRFLAYKESYDELRLAFHRLAAFVKPRRNVRFVDMSQFFVDTPDVIFSDIIHYNEQGTRRIAEHLLPLVLTLQSQNGAV